MSVVRTATCACGDVQLQLTGEPIVSATCHCDDCQAGARQIEALPGVRQFRDKFGGTPMALYRKDRYRVVRGQQFLERLKLRPGSMTNRVVASCCNSALLVDFDRGPHWVSVFSQALDGVAPKPEMRLNTKFVAPGTILPDDVPAYATAPFRFVWKLIIAKLAMVMGR